MRFYITKQLGTDETSEHFLAVDAGASKTKSPEYRVVRYRRELSARRDFTAPLEIEAASVNKLAHPNVLKLEATGVWDNACFVVYERGDGITLPEILQWAAGRPLDPTAVAAIAAQVLEALAYAHSGTEDPRGNRPRAFAAGLTPASIEITKAGVVKVLHFGGDALARTRRPNHLDTALGRLPYLHPRLLSGEPADARTDLFSLGALLWELLGGKQLPRGGNTKPPALSSFVPTVPLSLEAFLGRLLSADPTEQPRGASEAKVALDKALFAFGARADAATLAAWCVPIPRPDRVREGSADRKVLAEVVSTRELLKGLASPAASSAPAADPAPAAAAEKNAAPANAWDKSATYTEAPVEEEEPPKPRRALLSKQALALLAGLVLLLGGGALAWIFLPVWSGMQGGAAAGPLIPVTFAYRGPSDPARRVYVQGLRDEKAENLVGICGEGGEKCRCEFFLAADDAVPVANEPAGLSRKFNFAWCALPEGSPAKFVRLTGPGENPRRTNVLLVASSLSWQNVLGPALLRRNLRWVSSYECERVFFEGEGQAPDAPSACPPQQKLGVLQASYKFYVYRSEEGGGSKPAPEFDLQDPVCGIASLNRVHCRGEMQTLAFGLHAKDETPFTLPVTLFRAPTGEDTMGVAGYAVAADSGGLCPVGLINIQPWTAKPPTFGESAEGSLPSNFVNTASELDDHLYDTREPRHFVLTRKSSRTPCDGKGDCSLAAFNEAGPVLRVPYSKGDELCVLSPDLAQEPTKPDEVAAKAIGHMAESVPEVTVEIKTALEGYEARANGIKLEIKNNRFKAPLRKETRVEITKIGFLTQRFTVPALEAATTKVYEVAASRVQMGKVDLDSFPPSEATFWLNDEKVFSGPTPVKESLPAGNYKVTFKTRKQGTESERMVTIEDGRTATVDHLIKEEKKP